MERSNEEEVGEENSEAYILTIIYISSLHKFLKQWWLIIWKFFSLLGADGADYEQKKAYVSNFLRRENFRKFFKTLQVF